MAESILVTQTIREFSRLLYTETAASIQHLFENNSLPENFGLQKVRVCCGSEKENITNNKLNITDQSPWLAELYFGTNSEGSISTYSNYADYLNSKVGAMSCLYIQGIGKAWQARLLKYNLNTIEDLARCSNLQAKLICEQEKNIKILEFIGKAKIAIADCPTMPLCVASDYQLFDVPFLEAKKVLNDNPELHEKNWLRVQTYVMKLIAVLDDKAVKKVKIIDIL
jgi:hypothetical protein